MATLETIVAMRPNSVKGDNTMQIEERGLQTGPQEFYFLQILEENKGEKGVNHQRDENEAR